MRTAALRHWFTDSASQAVAANSLATINSMVAGNNPNTTSGSMEAKEAALQMEFAAIESANLGVGGGGGRGGNDSSSSNARTGIPQVSPWNLSTLKRLLTQEDFLEYFD